MDSSPQSNYCYVTFHYPDTHNPMAIETVIPKKSVIEMINSFIIRFLFARVEEKRNQNREPHHEVTVDLASLYHSIKIRTISKSRGSFTSKLFKFYKKLDAFLYSHLKL